MRYRWFVIGGGGVVVLLVVAAVVLSIGSNVTYYYFPNEAVDNRELLPDGETFRLAGHVVPGSVREVGDVLEFQVTDGDATIDVVLDSAPPPLFREEVPVLIEGAWDSEIFRGTSALIRHDENYEIPQEGTAIARP